MYALALIARMTYTPELTSKFARLEITYTTHLVGVP